MTRYFMKLTLFSALIMTVTAGCATQKQWSAVGGSRSDGVVKLAFDYGMFENPQLEPGQGVKLAAQRCRAWGYTGSEAFGGAMQQCIARNQHGCVAWRVSADYQCTGR